MLHTIWTMHCTSHTTVRPLLDAAIRAGPDSCAVLELVH